MQFVVCDFAKGQTTASLSANPARSINDMFGVNGANTIKSEMLLNNVNLQNKFAEFYAGHLRFPGGTVANYWDWEKAAFMKSDFNKHPCEWIYDDYATLVVTDNSLEDLKQVIDKSGAVPMYCLNATSSDRFYQLAMLYHAASINLPIKYVELGNELYKDSPCNYAFRHPKPADYATEMLEWTKLIKGEVNDPGHFPNTEIALTGGQKKTDDPRRNNWNLAVLPNSPYIGVLPIVHSNTNNLVDALTLHPYHGSRLGGTATNPENIGTTQNVNCLFSSPFHSYKGFSGAVFNEEIDDQINNVAYGNKEVWLTEYNLWDVTNVVHGSWAHALTVAYQSLLFLEKEAITKSSIHSMVGDAQWGVMFKGTEGLNINGSFKSPVINSGSIDLSCTNLNSLLPNTNQYDLTALGQATQIITRAAKNTNQVTQIDFSNLNLPASIIITCSADNPIKNYDGLYGWFFENSDPMENQVVIINFLGTSQEIELNNGLTNVDYMDYISTDFDDYFYGEGATDCFNQGYSNNPCDCTVDKEDEPILFTGNNKFFLKPYSITRLYKNKSCPSVKISATVTDICEGTDVGLQVNTLPLVSNTLGYQWSGPANGSVTGGGTSIIGNPGNISNPNDPFEVNTYTVTVTDGACSTSATIDITSHRKPSLDITTTPISSTNSIFKIKAELSNNGTPIPNSNFVWISDQSIGLGAKLGSSHMEIDVAIPEELTEYIVYATADEHCYVQNSIPLDALGNLGEDRNACNGVSINFSIDQSTLNTFFGSGPYIIEWIVIGGASVTGSTFPYTPLTGSIETIQVIVRDNSNTTLFTDEVTITGVDCCGIIPDPSNNFAHVEDGLKLSEFVKRYNDSNLLPKIKRNINNPDVWVVPRNTDLWF